MSSADFYIGRGRDAEYLGTATRGGSPDKLISINLAPGLHADAPSGLTGLNVWELFQATSLIPYTAGHFRAAVRALVDTETWPHGDRDPAETGWAYIFDRSSVYGYLNGAEMLAIRCNFGRYRVDRENPERRDFVERDVARDFLSRAELQASLERGPQR